MAFVSLTEESRERGEAFARQYRVPWPIGVAAAPRVITAFRAVRWGADAPGALRPGYAPIPTLFVIGSDGVVRWNDRCARYRHRDVRLLMQDLEREIESALAASFSRDR